MIKVVHLSEIEDTSVLFEFRFFMLGDQGNWFVIDEDGTPLGRYSNKEYAQSHADDCSEENPTDALL